MMRRKGEASVDREGVCDLCLWLPVLDIKSVDFFFILTEFEQCGLWVCCD